MVAAADAHDAALLFLAIEEPKSPLVDFEALVREMGLRWHLAPRLVTDAYTIPRNGHLNVEGNRRLADWAAPILARELMASSLRRGEEKMR